jgi:hypothetical protein
LAAAEDLLDAGVEVVALACGDFLGGWDAVFRTGGGEDISQFGAEFGLDGLVGGDEFDGPEEGCGGCVVTCDEEAEEL